MLRFAIIREVSEGQFVEVVPGYTDKQFLSRLKAKMSEQFLLTESLWKKKFSRTQCLKLMEIAYANCIDDLKEETITVGP
jgi:hypothetical protein